MGRAPCCDKANVKKGPWSPEEDSKLKEFIDKHGTGGNWIALPHKAGLKRCGKSCRLRWLNYLRPNIKHGEFSEEEDKIICNLFATIGSRWSIIASQLPGRTDNDIKNYWNTKLKKKLLGISASSQRKPHQSQQLFSSPVLPLQSTQLQGCYFNDPKPLPPGSEGFPAISPNAIPNYDPMQDLRYQFQMKETSNMIAFGTDQSCSTSDGNHTKISYGKYVGYDCGGGGGEQMAMEKSIYDDLDGSKLFLIGGSECELEYNYEENIKQLMNLSNFGCNNGYVSNISNFHLDDHPKAKEEREDPQPQYRTNF